MFCKFMPQTPAKAMATAKMPAQAARRFVICVSSIVTLTRLTWIAVPMVVRLLDLRPLAVPHVLVQAELRLHLDELFLRGVLQRHPDEAAGPGDELADVVDRAIGELAAVLVSDAVDQHVATSPEQKAMPILEAGRNRDEHREGESR